MHIAHFKVQTTIKNRLTMYTSNSSRHLKGDSVISHRDRIKQTVEKERSPPDKERMSFTLSFSWPGGFTFSRHNKSNEKEISDHTKQFAISGHILAICLWEPWFLPQCKRHWRLTIHNGTIPYIQTNIHIHTANFPLVVNILAEKHIHILRKNKNQNKLLKFREFNSTLKK